MAVDEFIFAFGIVAVVSLFYLVYAWNKNVTTNREYLVGMKEIFFPKLLENLSSIADHLEASVGPSSYSSVLENKLSPTLLWQFRIRFPKTHKEFESLKKKLLTSDNEAAKPLKDEEKPKLKDELENRRLALREEVKNLIREIEPLKNLKQLPPRILPFVNRA
ncbi:MAG: hypothetical protein QG670_2795 [Thermoproteota archaeon]|nr:hypothetical protein [Thermoproteota archaeon]